MSSSSFSSLKVLFYVLVIVFVVRLVYFYTYHSGASVKRVRKGSAAEVAASKRISVKLLKADPSAADAAVCLDGSAPGYVVKRGLLSQNWVIYLQGGGWCMDEADCRARSRTPLGSSRSWMTDEPAGFFTGLRSSNRTVNPWMHQWSVVVFRYCDGLSFSGDHTLDGDSDSPPLHSRGRSILKALFQAVADNEYGFYHAQELVLTGSSAGGLALLLHSESIRQFPAFPSSARVREIYDSAIFLDDADDPVMASTNGWSAEQLAPVRFFSSLRQRAVNQLHRPRRPLLDKFSSLAAIRRLLNATWANSRDAERPTAVARFFFQSIYDTWSLQHVLQLPCALKGPDWQLTHLCDDARHAQQLVLVHARTLAAVAELLVAGVPDGSVTVYASACACHGFTKHDHFFLHNSHAHHAFDLWWTGRSGPAAGSVVYDNVAKQLSDQLVLTSPSLCPNRSFIFPLPWELDWQKQHNRLLV